MDIRVSAIKYKLNLISGYIMWFLSHCVNMQNFQLWCDLREFELRMGCRYLTHEGDEEHWSRFALERGLMFPSYLCWDSSSEMDM